MYPSFIVRGYDLVNKVKTNLTHNYYRTFHTGSQYACPFCGHFYAMFAPTGFKGAVFNNTNIVGGGYRLNAICPNCKSGDRERMVYLFIQEHNLIQKQIKLLHVAPEHKLKELFEHSDIDYYSADLCSPLAKIKMDIRKIDFEDDYFDAIVCNHVLEHIIEDSVAMKELYRVLKPNGWAILQVPFAPELQETFEDVSVKSASARRRIFGQSDHVRIYGRDYVDRLQSVGFSTDVLKINELTIERYALNKDEKIFFCRKN